MFGPYDSVSATFELTGKSEVCNTTARAKDLRSAGLEEEERFQWSSTLRACRLQPESTLYTLPVEVKTEVKQERVSKKLYTLIRMAK